MFASLETPIENENVQDFAREVLGPCFNVEDREAFCDQCQGTQVHRCDKKISSSQYPSILHISAQRLCVEANGTYFDNVTIKFPFRLNMTEYFDGENQCNYDLVGVVMFHDGRINKAHNYYEGHFYVLVRDKINIDNWWKIDDHEVTRVANVSTIPNDNSDHWHLLLYEWNATGIAVGSTATPPPAEGQQSNVANDVRIAVGSTATPPPAEEICCICQDLLHGNNQQIEFTPCMHPFHADCLQRYYRYYRSVEPTRSISCPMCRHTIRLASAVRQPIPHGTNVINLYDNDRPASAVRQTNVINLNDDDDTSSFTATPPNAAVPRPAHTSPPAAGQRSNTTPADTTTHPYAAVPRHSTHHRPATTDTSNHQPAHTSPPAAGQRSNTTPADTTTHPYAAVP